MADYYLAASLVALRTEINRRWPNRDKASDGWIGDTSHQARKSDHNPDYDSGGVVRAIDVDKDGINVTELLAAVVRDPRVAYVIWNRRIASATDDGVPWDWEPYSGSNPHDKHIHISIKHTRAAETTTSRWFDTPTAPTTPSLPKDDDMPTPEETRTIVRQENEKYGARLWAEPTGTGTKFITSTRAALASLTTQVAGLSAALKALAEQQGVDPDVIVAAVTEATDKAVGDALADLKITLAVDDDEPSA